MPDITKYCIYTVYSIELQAVCCADKIHCCPHDYTCDDVKGKCRKDDHFIDFLTKLPASPVSEVRVKNVPCPGEKQACPDGTTCCQMASGQYACCPAPSVSLSLSSNVGPMVQHYAL